MIDPDTRDGCPICAASGNCSLHPWPPDGYAPPRTCRKNRYRDEVDAVLAMDHHVRARGWRDGRTRWCIYCTAYHITEAR